MNIGDKCPCINRDGDVLEDCPVCDQTAVVSDATEEALSDLRMIVDQGGAYYVEPDAAEAPRLPAPPPPITQGPFASPIDLIPTGIGPGIDRIVPKSKDVSSIFMSMAVGNGTLDEGPLAGRTFNISTTAGLGGMDMIVEFNREDGDDMMMGRDRFMIRTQVILQSIIALLTNERRLRATIRHAFGAEIKLHHIGEVVPSHIRDAAGHPIGGAENMTRHRHVYVVEPTSESRGYLYVVASEHPEEPSPIAFVLEHDLPPGAAWTMWGVP